MSRLGMNTKLSEVPSLDALVSALKRLPGVGFRSAQRIAYHLLQHDREALRVLAQAFSDAFDRVHPCSRCQVFTEQEICETCLSSKRDSSLLCVVETPSDQLMLEQTMSYSGMYFILMGHLSPLTGIGPSDIGFENLLERVSDGIVKEVIIATNFTQEGELTAHYLGELLARKGLIISRLARGVPVGSELEYVDLGTLAQALRDRRKLDAKDLLTDDSVSV